MSTRFLTVVLLLIISTVSFAQLRARDCLSAGTYAAQSITGDNQLFWICSGLVDSTGRSSNWALYFRTSSHVSNTSVTVLTTGTYLDRNVTPRTPDDFMPNTYVNSDVAVQSTEANGGAAFRASHPGATISMYAGPFGVYSDNYASYNTRMLWVAKYCGYDGNILIVTDLATGSYLWTQAANGTLVSLSPDEEKFQKENHPNDGTTKTFFSLPGDKQVAGLLGNNSAKEDFILKSPIPATEIMLVSK